MKHCLHLDNLCVKFYQEPNIINGVSVDIGQDTVIFGGEDSGKSLLLKAICGLEKYSGSVLFDNNKIDIKKQEISLLLNPPVLFDNKTLVDNYKNLQKVMKISQKQLNNIDYFQIFELNDVKYKKVKELNLFQKRVFCLLRAYAKKSKLLLLDEILDDLCEVEVKKIIGYLKLFEDCLIIYVTKNPKLYEHVSKNFRYLKFGQIVHFSTMDDLYLAKLNYDAQHCSLINNILQINLCSINLTDKQVKIITDNCLNEMKLAIIETNNVYYVFDEITSEKLIEIKKEV